jgi:hypothetical protein
MPGPVQLNITLTTTGNPVVVIPIPASLQALDSGASGGQGQAAGQTGYSSVSELVRSIFRAHCFFVPSTNTWYSAYVIQSITWS